MGAGQQDRAPRPRGRPAIDEAAVLSVAMQLVYRAGVRGVTTQAIADQAGVAKASLYRRWPTRAVLLAEAILGELRKGAPLDETMAPRDAVLDHVTRFARGLRGKLGPALRGVTAECLLDPEATAFRDFYLRHRRDSALRIIARGIADGSFAGGASAEDRHDALYGALFYRFLFQVGDLRDGAVRALVDDVLVRPGRAAAP